MESRKMLPVGINSFTEAVTRFYYVDKTLLIKDLLDNMCKVFLFTRPRRFGKSLNLDMVKTFFEKTDKDTSVYFKDLEIWKQGERYTSEQGKYPVVSISFKGADCRTWDETFYRIKRIVTDEFSRHDELEGSNKIKRADSFFYNDIICGAAQDEDYSSALLVLTRMLKAHYGTAPIVLIDEYDVPVTCGYTNGFYGNVINFMRNFLSDGLKDNGSLYFGIMTGALKVSKESIFTGLNNVVTCSILDERFRKYFGFTHREVVKMLDDFGCPEKYGEVLEWYDGYNFGGLEMFNPWSVINYIYEGCKPKAYWAHTSGNEVIGLMLRKTAESTADKIRALIRGEEVTCLINEDTVYADLDMYEGSVFSLLLLSGYLKVSYPVPVKDDFEDARGLMRKAPDGEGGGSTGRLMRVTVPNREVMEIYEGEFLSRLDPGTKFEEKIWESILSCDREGLEGSLGEFIEGTVSVFDMKNSEAFYHGFMICLCLHERGRYEITSNRESGDGLYDIQLEPKGEGYPAVIIEIECIGGNSAGSGELERRARAAIGQINRKRYCAYLTEKGYMDIIKLGIAFQGKSVRAEFE